MRHLPLLLALCTAQAMREAGVIAPESFHVHVRLNGKFYGLFAYVESINGDYLQVAA